MGLSVRIAFAALALAGCTPAPAPTPSPAPTTSAAALLRPHAGTRYSAFVQLPGQDQYSPSGLRLNEADQVRLNAAMTAQEPAILAQGGGAEALVFTGCAATSCQDGLAVVAIDTGTGMAFAGVRDAAGAEVLVPNDRVLALLEITSTTGRWDGAMRRAPTAPAPP